MLSGGHVGEVPIEQAQRSSDMKERRPIDKGQYSGSKCSYSENVSGAFIGALEGH